MFTNKQKTRFANVVAGYSFWKKQNQFKAPKNSFEFDRLIKMVIKDIEQVDRYKATSMYLRNLWTYGDDDNPMYHATKAVNEHINIKELAIYEMYDALRDHCRNATLNNGYRQSLIKMFDERFNNNEKVGPRIREIMRTWSNR